MKKVPFFANTADDTHCVQAAFKMMLKYFLPERDFSFAELDRMSRRTAGKGTWWPPMLLALQALGLEARCIEGFDYEMFYKEGKDYVRQVYPLETAKYYLERSNLMDIRPMIPEFLEKIRPEARPASFSDLDELLTAGWLVGLELNAKVLNDSARSEYVGHMVVVFDKQNDYYSLHDPGLKPHRNRQVSRQKLADSWFWSGAENAALVAVKSL